MNGKEHSVQLSAPVVEYPSVGVRRPMTFYDTWISLMRNQACLAPTDVIEIVPTSAHVWAHLEIRDVWTKRVYGRVTFHFESVDFEPHLKALDIMYQFDDTGVMTNAVNYAAQRGAQKIEGGWIRFDVTQIHDEIIDAKGAGEFLFQVARFAHESASRGASRIPVTVWSDAIVKHATSVHARSPEEAQMRALRGSHDWYVHALRPEEYGRPKMTAIAGVDAGSRPPAAFQKACLNCKHMQVYTSFAGSDVTPAETSQRCTKQMTMPVGGNATYCPGWEEGTPDDDSDRDSDG